MDDIKILTIRAITILMLPQLGKKENIWFAFPSK